MQNDEILMLLKQGPLTPMDALKKVGCMRIAARIWELRQMGYHISREWHVTRSGKKVARYSLQTEPRTKGAA